MIAQVALYAGLPRGVDANMLLREVFDEDHERRQAPASTTTLLNIDASSSEVENSCWTAAYILRNRMRARREGRNR